MFLKCGDCRQKNRRSPEAGTKESDPPESGWTRLQGGSGRPGHDELIIPRGAHFFQLERCGSIVRRFCNYHLLRENLFRFAQNGTNRAEDGPIHLANFQLPSSSPFLVACYFPKSSTWSRMRSALPQNPVNLVNPVSKESCLQKSGSGGTQPLEGHPTSCPIFFRETSQQHKICESCPICG
jgi:hypothetical protein